MASKKPDSPTIRATLRMKAEKYYMKSTEVTAVQYEDNARYISIWLERAMVVEKNELLRVPGTACKANKGDYIVKDKKGNVFSYNPKDFNNDFKSVDNG